MLEVRHKFKQFTDTVLAFFKPLPLSDFSPQAVQQRKNDALVQFAQAFITVLIGLWVAPLFEAQGTLVIIAAVVCSVPFVIQGFKLWMSAITGVKSTTVHKSPSSSIHNSRTSKSPSPTRRDARTPKSPTPAAKSNQREDIVGIILSDLQQQGWKITYSLPIPKLGEVDVFLQSPNNNYFIVNVQSYRGEVFFDEGILKRRDWREVSNFEKDLLGHIMDQVLAVKKLKRLRSVTPLLCFTEATLSIETVNNKARDVYVVKKESLVRKLVRLDQS